MTKEIEMRVHLSLDQKPIRLLTNSSLAVLTAVLLVFTALAMSARAWVLRDNAGGSSTAARISGKSITASPQARSGKQRVEGEIIAITSHGFEPTQITRPTGSFLLVVDNRSGLQAITLLLNGDVGLPLRNVLVRREQRNWSDIVDLPPGNYALKEATHPGWVCHITIR
jgi:hypothetical protein